MRKKYGTSFVYVDAIANVDNITPKSSAQDLACQRILTQQVIAVNPRGEKSRSHTESAIDCSTLTPIGLADPKREPMGIFLNDLNRVALLPPSSTKYSMSG